MFMYCWLTPRLQAGEGCREFWQRVFTQLCCSTAELKGEIRQRQAADAVILELAPVMAHDTCLLMALTYLVLHTQDTSQIFA